MGVEPKPGTSTELWPIADENKEVTWRWGRDTIAANPDEILAIRSGNSWTLHKKQRPSTGVVPSKKPKSTFYSPKYSATTATTTVKEIFGNTRTFDYPKSPHFLHDLISISGAGPGDIILDSFAGSGTTAHAVLALNKEDGGNRKFILIECEDYADTITAERVRRVINGVENATNEVLRNGLGGSFTYCTLGEPIDEEGMLTGETLPTYEALADYIAYTATGNALTSIAEQADYCFGETDDIRFYLIYEPTLQFLESNKSALDGERAEQIAKVCKETGKKAYVYAPQKFISQKELTGMGITFCQLPYNIHRISDA